MTENIARDYCGEALASAGVKSNGSASSDRDQNKNTAGGDNNKASARFTMDPKSGLTAEVVKGAGKNIRTETVWIAAAFEILGRVRDPRARVGQDCCAGVMMTDVSMSIRFRTKICIPIHLCCVPSSQVLALG